MSHTTLEKKKTAQNVTTYPPILLFLMLAQLIKANLHLSITSIGKEIISNITIKLLH